MIVKNKEMDETGEEKMYRKERIYPKESTVFSNKGKGDDSPLKEMTDALGELKRMELKRKVTLQCYQLYEAGFFYKAENN